MFTNRSKLLFVAAVIASVYVIYLITYFGKASSESAGGAVATVLVFPHMLIHGLGAVFQWIGFAVKKSVFALFGVILHVIGIFVFIPYFIFSVPIFILGFIGWSAQKKAEGKTA